MMLWMIEIFWPFLLPLAIALFIFITEQTIWRKFSIVLLPMLSVIVEIFSENIYITITSQLVLIAFLIGLLIYYYNKRII
ncbi:MAG: hypothetical protein HOB92_06295 [Candidatus Cloacimonetes bacterium]|nr:hypothetical protein [Candidatus Cloacimonadota bacterium]